MALCLNGSQVKAGAPPFVWVSWVDANSWLGSLFSKFSFLSYLIPSVLYEINSFCAVEPNQPVYPGDAAVAAAAHDPAAFDTVIQYLKDSAVWWVWSHQCECKAATGCASVMTDATWNGMTSASGAGGNYHWELQFIPQHSGLTVYGWEVKAPVAVSAHLKIHDVTAATIPVDEIHAITPGRQQYYMATPLALVAGHDYRAAYYQGTGVGEINFTNSGSATPASTTDFHFPQWVYGQLDSGADNATYPGQLGIAPLVCQLSPTTPTNPPVPTTSIPDVPLGPCSTVGDLCGILQPTIQQVGLLQQRIDLIQRRLLPFAWIAGTPHTGLTGSGSIAVTDILGVIVSLTTVPTRWGSTAETPRRLIPSAASIQASDGTEFQDFHQVHYEHQVIMFDPGWATSVSYNFKPGIVATIVPLLPEP